MKEKEFEQLAKELLEYCKTYQRLEEVRLLKIKKAKEQRYEEAARMRDEQKVLILELPSEERFLEIEKMIKL